MSTTATAVVLHHSGMYYILIRQKAHHVPYCAMLFSYFIYAKARLLANLNT